MSLPDSSIIEVVQGSILFSSLEPVFLPEGSTMKSTSLPAHTNRTMRFAIALAVTACAVTVGHLLGPWLGQSGLYVFAFPAIAFSALGCGIAPSIASSLLAAAAFAHWLISPLQTRGAVITWQTLGLLAFLAACALIIVLAEQHRCENENLRIAQEELELRVKLRTAELDVANQGLSDLTARVMHLQDEERRRIARELHDSIGQMLAALTMNLTSAESEIARLQNAARNIVESKAIIGEMNKEVRTISYLLHPPLLDEAGLGSAIRWYVEGFSQRGNVQVELYIPEDFGRLPRETETAVFRTVQECLTNIHRHSESPIATIVLSRSDDKVRLKVQDGGRGIPEEKLNEIASRGAPGVGIRGMRERIRQLGGALVVESDEKGTTVEAHLPVTIPAIPVGHSPVAALKQRQDQLLKSVNG
jgi:signal transduction histidine kinase